MKVFTIYHEINVMKQLQKLKERNMSRSRGELFEQLNSTRYARLFNSWIGSPHIANTKTIADYASKAYSWKIKSSLVYSNHGVNNPNSKLKIRCEIGKPITVHSGSRNRIRTAHCVIPLQEQFEKKNEKLAVEFVGGDILFENECDSQSACFKITSLYVINKSTHSYYDATLFFKERYAFKSGRSNLLIELSGEKSRLTYFQDSHFIIQNVVKIKPSNRKTKGYLDLNFASDGTITATNR